MGFRPLDWVRIWPNETREASLIRPHMPGAICDAQLERPGAYHPFLCTESFGHSGDHIARGLNDEEIKRWPREP